MKKLGLGLEIHVGKEFIAVRGVGSVQKWGTRFKGTSSPGITQKVHKGNTYILTPHPYAAVYHIRADTPSFK